MGVGWETPTLPYYRTVTGTNTCVRVKARAWGPSPGGLGRVGGRPRRPQRKWTEEGHDEKDREVDENQQQTREQCNKNHK